MAKKKDHNKNKIKIPNVLFEAILGFSEDIFIAFFGNSILTYFSLRHCIDTAQFIVSVKAKSDKLETTRESNRGNRDLLVYLLKDFSILSLQ